MEKGMWGEDCEERGVGRRLWEEGWREWTVRKGIRGWDCGEKDVGRGL